MPKKIIPAHLYDALEKAANRFGGIGSHEYEDKEGNPLCAYGLLYDALDEMAKDDLDNLLPFSKLENDAAVIKARRRLGLVDPIAKGIGTVETGKERTISIAKWDDHGVCHMVEKTVTWKYVYETRIPFAEWVQEMAIVRGEPLVSEN